MDGDAGIPLEHQVRGARPANGNQRPRRSTVTVDTARVPAGSRIYAIGDIHGRLDLLRRLLKLIHDHDQTKPPAHRFLIFLGDYIDRGPDSKGVIETLMTGIPPGFRTVCLKGNHEAAMLGFLADIHIGAQWLGGGAIATLASYGVTVPASPPTLRDRLALIQSALRERLPDSHAAFLAGLPTRVAIGDYLFVHAGIRPGVALSGQTDDDMIWIREEFLSCTQPLPKVVIHGHTIRETPEVRINRIGIDTGAFTTNRLTCVVLEECGYTFIAT